MYPDQRHEMCNEDVLMGTRKKTKPSREEYIHLALHAFSILPDITPEMEACTGKRHEPCNEDGHVDSQRNPRQATMADTNECNQPSPTDTYDTTLEWTPGPTPRDVQRGWPCGFTKKTQDKQPWLKFIECNQLSPTDTYDTTLEWTPGPAPQYVQQEWPSGFTKKTQDKQPWLKFIECNQPSPTDTYADVTPKLTPDQRKMTKMGRWPYGLSYEDPTQAKQP
ncbi:hypothetical protein HOLleu_28811 [Holothuria leucospilota]|uniref:Uncharacterized protein n=1 Tax=Holothuria leucospilota TaxID=206669 RepID=A0A9Q1H180_HOLLE|nr:hypothetical protein HOLleu_28811 [Holothuria leucospilota]